MTEGWKSAGFNEVPIRGRARCERMTFVQETTNRYSHWINSTMGLLGLYRPTRMRCYPVLGTPSRFSSHARRCQHEVRESRCPDLQNASRSPVPIGKRPVRRQKAFLTSERIAEH